jgi:hypothetical protein
MKIWRGYGSEHSMNLVMIGTFDTIEDATQAEAVIDRVTNQVSAEVQGGEIQVGEFNDRISDTMRELLMELHLYTIGANELEHFHYDTRVAREGNRLILTTDEADVSAFLKVFVARGARVEVYSAHDHRGTGYGRAT